MKFLIISLFTLVSTAAELAPMHVKNTKESIDFSEKTDTKVYMRHIYMKLPLLQPRFHWVFTEKKKFLAGSLTLTIESGIDKREVPIFGKGVISRNWEILKCGSQDDPENSMYFCFVSKKPYKVSGTNKVFLSLKVKDDIKGIGADLKGILKAGDYKSEGQFLLYHLAEHTGKKDIYAFLNNSDWNILWKLEKTSDKGWMEDKYNTKNRIKLSSHKSVYNIELDFKKGGKSTISVVNHKTKEYFFEYFNTVDDLAEYLQKNKKNVPDEIKHQGLITEVTKEYLKKCKEIEEKIHPVKFIYAKDANDSHLDSEKGNVNFFSEYKRRNE